MEKNQNCLVYVTVKDEGKRGFLLLRRWWKKGSSGLCQFIFRLNQYSTTQNQIQTQDEAVLILKTTAQAYDKLESFIIEIHSYDDPCILKLPIEGGAADFMSWIKDTVAS